MPRCDGLPNWPCPKNVSSRTVKLSLGDLMLCPACDVARFPQYVKSSAGEVKDTPCTSDGTPVRVHAPLYAKLQQQISELWNAHRKLAADVITV